MKTAWDCRAAKGQTGSRKSKPTGDPWVPRWFILGIYRHGVATVKKEVCCSQKWFIITKIN